MTVLITGASSGIGRATADLLVRRGEPLILAARAMDALDEFAGANVVPTDVSDADAVDALFDQCGPLDAVVHCAAVMAYGRFEEIPAEVFEQVVRINLLGTANVARASLRHFREQGGGRLVLVSSLLGKTAIPFSSPYVTSKWAVHGLGRVLQMEGAPVTLISPGSIDTPIYRRAANYIGREGRPIPPVHSPNRVARAIVRAISKPRRERSVGIANHVVVGAFRLLPIAYDAAAATVVRFGGLRRRPATPSPGNAFTPTHDDDPGRSTRRHRTQNRRYT